MFNAGTSQLRFVLDNVDLGEVSSVRVPPLSSQPHATNDACFSPY